MPTQTIPIGLKTQIETNILNAFADILQLTASGGNSDCCGRQIDDINDFEVCRGCGRVCSEEQ